MRSTMQLQKILLPFPFIFQQPLWYKTIANSTTSNISLDVTIPDEAIHNANVKMAQIKLEKAVFEQVKAPVKHLPFMFCRF